MRLFSWPNAPFRNWSPCGLAPKGLNMRESRPLASLSLDLDNQWSYMKTHGDAGWQSLPSYLHAVVPRVLQILKERQLTITFFVVGLDVSQESNQDLLRSVVAAGHEIGNHSYQ